MNNGEQFFLQVAPLLEKYYGLVELVNKNTVLTKEDLSPFFSSEIIREIISIQQLYIDADSKRSCGNPAFVHSLRATIWSVALGFGTRTSRVVLGHDVVEDFGKDFLDMSSLLETVPEDVRKDIAALTNSSKVFVKELVKAEPETKEELLSFIKSFEDSPNKGLNATLDVISSKVESYDGNESVLNYLIADVYQFYLDELFAYVKEHDASDVVIAKMLDRLDNTFSDYPSKYAAITRLYTRNYQVLSMAKPFVISSADPMMRLVFLLLIERSLKQIGVLRANYDAISRRRGLFYGRQYLRLVDELSAIENKLKEFLPEMKSLSEDKDVLALVKELKNK